MNDLRYRILRYTLSFYSPEIRYGIASEVCGDRAKYVPGDMLYAINKRYGLLASLYADVILFGWCFAACLATDLLPLPDCLWTGLPAALSCVIAFGLCRDHVHRAVLKLGFICFSFFCPGWWTLTAFFLLVFEHLIFNRKLSGGKDQT